MICWVRSIYRMIRHMLPFDGHDWVNDEEDVPALVTTGHCGTCGASDVVWKRRGGRA